MAKKAQQQAAPAAGSSAVAGALAGGSGAGDIADAPKLEQLIWTRDKFASGLQNLEHGVRELRLAFLNHFNSLLPEGHPGRLEPPFLFSGTTAFSEPAPQAGSLPVAAPAAVPAAGAPGSNTKRKRKPHDPNAPKRALTSYFLFMQTTKPQIKQEHPDWNAGQISEESERRWANIDPAEKQRYEYMYNIDLARYYKQKEEYDAGRPIPTIGSDEALKLYEEHLRTGTLIKGRKGRRVLDAAAAAGQSVSAQANANIESSDDDDNAGKTGARAGHDETEGDDDSDAEQAPAPKGKKQKTNRSTPAKPSDTPKRKVDADKKGRGKKAPDASENSPADVVAEADKKKADKKANRKRKSTGEK